MSLDVGQLKDRSKKRKLLALDDGGIRGVLSLEILLQLEGQRKAVRRAGPDFRLCQYYWESLPQPQRFIAVAITRRMRGDGGGA